MLLDAAQQIVLRRMPVPTEEERAAFILAGQERSLRVACTSMQGGPLPIDVARTYARLDREGRLRQRAFLWAPLLASQTDFDAWVALARSLPEGGKVQIVAFKGFADGTIAASTAALLEPYADDPSARGEVYVPEAALERAVLRANRAGFPVAIHAMGDAAVRAALDAYAASRRALGHALVNRVEHATIIHPDDIPRFAELGVAASVQPVWIQGYASARAFTPLTRLGQGRVDRIYPWGSLARSGAFLIFGSDLPSSQLDDPLTGLFAATERRFSNGEPFTPTERVDADLALRAYTESPALAIGWGNRLGRIAPGYEADLVLLDHDPRAGARSLAEDPARAVWVAGTRTQP
jgi:predicted amidohydrolase YtcJ